VSWRTRWLTLSAVKMMPVGETSRPNGVLKSATVAKPFMYPAVPLKLPAMVCTRPEDRLTARMRFPFSSDTYSTRALASSATPRGPLKVASVPTPLLPPDDPFPARVATLAVTTSIRLTRLVLHSPTNRIPLECHAAENGPLNCALVPLPSAKPQDPLPASVVTETVERSIARTLQPCCSTIKAVLPSEVRAIPEGPLNCATVPMPLLPPAEPLPASVDTSPAGEIRRMRCEEKSATNTVPRLFTGAEHGL
jgi:hypothetical protein